MILYMNSKLPFLVALVATVRGSFLQTQPNHSNFHSNFNSTFLKESDQLFKPIIIPNITETDANEAIHRKTPQPNEIPQESKLRENYLDEEPRTTGISLKFSSRYSTKSFEEDQTDRPEENQSKEDETSENSTETTNQISEQHKFSDRSDDLTDSEDQEEEDTSNYDEPNQPKRSEIASTTNEPYSELPTSFQTSPNDDFENYETTSTSSEETDNSEEKHEPEAKRSLKNHYNDSKKYHSIQTPLTEVKYRGPHSFTGELESEEPRTRLLAPFPRQHVKHNWPYSKSQIKEELDDLNEISDSDESLEEDLDEAVKEEVKTNPKLDLESAVEKDERNRNKKYNYIEEKNRRKEQQKSLAAAEAKDDKGPPLRIPKQYQVVEPKYQPIIRDGHKHTVEDIWAGKYLSTTPNTSGNKFGISGEDQSQEFLGPVVFNHNLEPKKLNPVAKPSANHFRQQTRNQVLKGLQTSEKLDQDNLTNQRIQKTVFATQSFNHLAESDEMYNAILANIRSVFGVRTPPPSSGSGKNSPPEVEVDESKLFTWSLPLKRLDKVN